MKQLLILGLNGPYNSELLKALIAELQQAEPSLEILHANHAHDGGPGIHIGTVDDIAAAGVRVVAVPASELSEHSLTSIGTDVKKLLQEFRAEVRREVKDDKGKSPKIEKKKGPPAAEDKPAEDKPAGDKQPGDAATPQAGETGASAQTQEAEGLAGELAEVLGKSTDETQPPDGGDVQA